MFAFFRPLAALALLVVLGSPLPRTARASVETFTVIGVDSGVRPNPAVRRATTWSRIVHVPGAAWLRLEFDGTTLAPGAAVRVTGLRDGARQTLDGLRLEQWQATSAYFNGDAVLVELLGAPRDAMSRVVVPYARSGDHPDEPAPPAPSICGATDDRVPSDDPRIGRTFPGLCTAFLIDDANRCLLSAGHCSFQLDVVMFNVPLSNLFGDVALPPPSEQYVVDPFSLQFEFSTFDRDWSYFACYPNSETGLRPFQAQGDWFTLAEAVPPPDGRPLRRTGYGATSAPISPTWNQAQKTTAGPFTQAVDFGLFYVIDTTSGDSGSPVVDESTGTVVAVHTVGFCAQGANGGTGIENPALRNALENPLGLCVPCPPGPDCNANDFPDACDIADGASTDCDEDGTPDECQIAVGAGDCNANGVLDACEVLAVVDRTSAPLGPVGAGFLHTFTIDAPPVATGDVTLDFTASADLDLLFEAVTVTLNGVDLGFAFLEGGTHCADPPDADTIVVPRADFNDAVASAGAAVIAVVGTGEVGLTECTDSFIQVRATYPFLAPADRNGNGVPDDCEPGTTDLDGDGDVDGDDLSLVLATWGACAPDGPCPADLDGSGHVGFADLAAVLNAWGTNPG